MSLEPYIEKRPWGQFTLFTHNELSTVKIITVNPGEQLSLQYHDHREEFWRVLSGKGEITVGDKVHKAKMGDEFFVPQGTNHTVKADDHSELSFLEIALGEFDEDDIVRIKDKYGRK